MKKAESSKFFGVRNFPITLACKSILTFIKAQNIEEFKIDTFAVVIYGREGDKKRARVFKEKMQEAESLCKIEVYSKLIFEIKQYDIISINEVKQREYKEAIVVICEVSSCKDWKILPYVYPRVLISYKVENEEDEERSEEESKNSSEEDSEQDSDSSKGKKKKQKREKDKNLKKKKNKYPSDSDEEERICTKTKRKGK